VWPRLRELCSFDIPIAPWLNFVNAETEIALIGTPRTGVKCQDIFFEHHSAAAMGVTA
jgi:hypothetical protein